MLLEKDKLKPTQSLGSYMTENQSDSTLGLIYDGFKLILTGHILKFLIN